MFAMTNKTLRNSLTALAAFAIAVTYVIASSFAAEFTVHQGKRYRATLALNSVEQLANNALIARRFRALGLSRVRVSGSGARLARSTKHRSRPKPTSNGSAKNQRPKIGRRATQETPSEIG
jgi:hypothetical protein